MSTTLKALREIYLHRYTHTVIIQALYFNYMYGISNCMVTIVHVHVHVAVSFQLAIPINFSTSTPPRLHVNIFLT